MLFFTHMGMLTPKDIKRIGEEVGKVIEDNILPLIDEKLTPINGQITAIREEMKTGFDRLDRRLDRTDGKLNTLVNVLHRKRVITEDDKRLVV